MIAVLLSLITFLAVTTPALTGLHRMTPGRCCDRFSLTAHGLPEDDNGTSRMIFTLADLAQVCPRSFLH